MGRFVTKDPIGFKGGINAYAYAKNNPVKYRDPSGLYETLFGPSPSLDWLLKNECYNAAMGAFSNCAIPMTLGVSFGMDIALAGCIFTGPGMTLCMEAVLGISGGPEIFGLVACGKSAYDTYNSCKKCKH